MPVVRIRRIIDDAGAEAVIAAAEKVANENGYRVVFAVVDPWGEVIQLRRTQNAQRRVSRVDAGWRSFRMIEDVCVEVLSLHHDPEEQVIQCIL